MPLPPPYKEVKSKLTARHVGAAADLAKLLDKRGIDANSPPKEWDVSTRELQKLLAGCHTVSSSDGQLTGMFRLKRSTLQLLSRGLGVSLPRIAPYMIAGRHLEGSEEKFWVEPYTESQFMGEYFPGMNGVRDLREAFVRIYTHLTDSLSNIKCNPSEPDLPLSVTHIRDLWSQNEQDHLIPDGTMVSIQGSLSVYSPVYVGNPSTKRDIHKAIRKLMGATSFGDPVADAVISLSSGQCVWNLGEIKCQSFGALRVLAVYQSIVRNGILVLCSSDVYEKVQDKFRSEKTDVLAATVRGRLVVLPRFRGVASAIANKNVNNQVNRRRPPRALLVLSDEGAIIPSDQDSLYLDGDIFALVRDRQIYELKTAFLDLAYPAEVCAERQELEKEINSEPGTDVEFYCDDLKSLEDAKHAARFADEVRAVTPQIEAPSYKYPSSDDLSVNVPLAIQDPKKFQREADCVITYLQEGLKGRPLVLEVDLGTGRADLPLRILSKFARCQLVVGLEPDATRAKSAAENLAAESMGRGLVVNGNHHALKRWPSSRLDACTCIQVIGHIPTGQLASLFDSVYHILKPSAPFVLCLPVVGRQFAGRSGAGDWEPGGDFFHVVDLTKHPFEAGFRTPLSRESFDRQSQSPEPNRLPVRSFFSAKFPESIVDQTPKKDDVLPVAIKGAMKGKFDFLFAHFYSFHQLAANDNAAAIGDLIVALRKHST